MCGGLGWLLQLTQDHSLCILASPRPALAHPELYTAVWQGLLATPHPHDSNVLPAGSVDPCRESASTRRWEGALESSWRSSGDLFWLPVASCTHTSCPVPQMCMPDTLGSYGSRILTEKRRKSMCVTTLSELCTWSCAHQQSKTVHVSGRGCLLGWNPAAACLAGTHRSRH
jgi:hypothetical protein